MECRLWDICYSAIHTQCIKDYSPEQLKAWAPANVKNVNENILLDDSFHKNWHAKVNALDPFVAKLNNQIVGYADLQPDGLIDHFFVHGDWVYTSRLLM